jgi:hypothetical protein
VTAARVILITVAGPRGHVDIGVRSDATPAELADALGSVLGVGAAAQVIEHRSPPRPGVPAGQRVLVDADTALAEAQVADGDLVLFIAAGGSVDRASPGGLARPGGLGTSAPGLARLDADQDATWALAIPRAAPTGPEPADRRIEDAGPGQTGAGQTGAGQTGTEQTGTEQTGTEQTGAAGQAEPDREGESR